MKMLSKTLPFAVHVDGDAVVFQQTDQIPVGELRALVGVEDIRGAEMARASSSASTQKAASSGTETFQESTYRLCQSMTATR